MVRGVSCRTHSRASKESIKMTDFNAYIEEMGKTYEGYFAGDSAFGKAMSNLMKSSTLATIERSKDVLKKMVAGLAYEGFKVESTLLAMEKAWEKRVDFEFPKDLVLKDKVKQYEVVGVAFKGGKDALKPDEAVMLANILFVQRGSQAHTIVDKSNPVLQTA